MGFAVSSLFKGTLLWIGLSRLFGLWCRILAIWRRTFCAKDLNAHTSCGVMKESGSVGRKQKRLILWCVNSLQPHALKSAFCYGFIVPIEAKQAGPSIFPCHYRRSLVWETVHEFLKQMPSTLSDSQCGAWLNFHTDTEPKCILHLAFCTAWPMRPSFQKISYPISDLRFPHCKAKRKRTDTRRYCVPLQSLMVAELGFEPWF